MSLKKKDQSAPGGLRVAANDPHLVSLGGGRLSTAVTLHYLPIGDVNIGSSPHCNISLNGSGVRSLHCTVYRSEEGEVTIVPETDARVLIDGNKITTEANLNQGAMLTIGNSNYLRFNNPAEAQLIKSTIGSNERISMPHIDFTQDKNGSNRGLSSTDLFSSFHESVESQTFKKQNNESTLNKSTNGEYITLNNFHSPKVFTADSITVNTPAKDVLGPKYASFAKNLAENHRNDKNVCTKNNEMTLKANNYVNIPSGFIQNPSSSEEILAKVNNNVGSRNQLMSSSSTYDRYPKPGTYYSGLQLFPMNGINSEMNSSSCNSIDFDQNLEIFDRQAHSIDQPQLSPQEQERLDEILKICTEYDRQNQSLQSSPIVQNRIKTNGSLPREKKSPFYDINPQPSYHSKTYFSEKVKATSGYENVRIVNERRIEIGATCNGQKNSSGYENVIVGKCIPQSPRTKIRTICASPKKDVTPNVPITIHNHSQGEYSHLIQTFEDKLKLEIQAIKENSKFNDDKGHLDKSQKARKRDNRNINNLTLNLKAANKSESQQHDYQRPPTVNNKSNQSDIRTQNMKQRAVSPEATSLIDLRRHREEVLSKIRKLKTQIADVQRQEDEVLRELDMEKALVSAELTTTNTALLDIEKNLSSLQAKIYRLEAQRNANRVMQETQQAKLKQAIEMKQEHIFRLEKLVDENKMEESLREELDNNIESLENDKKTFEDMEFQYLEEETEWLAYREELHSDLKNLSNSMEEKRMLLLRLESQEFETQNSACIDTKTLESNLLTLLTMLERTREELQAIDKHIFEISGHQQVQTDSDDEDSSRTENRNDSCMNRAMSQSLFGSTEILSAKPRDTNIMTRSINENMFFNNIEMPSQSECALSTSTPKKEMSYIEMKSIDITPEIVSREHNDEKDPILRLKYNVQPSEDQQGRANLNLSLGSDDFEVNPLEKRIPSQDDIDRICKVTTDAPISTEGASSKIFESIKEIERNRQLLLAQQGSHVIEHERQKMMELKKKSHDEARAIYLLTQNGVKEPKDKNCTSDDGNAVNEKDSTTPLTNEIITPFTKPVKQHESEIASSPSHQRYSQPELESQRLSRPLSEANSEISYDNLSENHFRSTNDIASVSNRFSNQSDDVNKRSSVSSNTTVEGEKLVSGSKRNLPKHQRPLTRYLPIMSPDLDLRQHIESAGHQIALCPHVFIDKYSCRGYLHKLGATFHGWSRRWFVLDRQRNALIYYSDKSEKKPRGGAYFSTIDEVYLDHLNTSKSGRPHSTFIVKTKKRSYHLQAASDAAARIWIDAIITGAQGNIDY